MTDSLARPTPRLLAQAPRRESPTAPPPYDRRVWERAVMSGDLHSNARLIALVLAHHAGDTGHFPAGQVPDARNLTRDAALTGKFTRISLNSLEAEGYISRPSIHDWTEPRPRPIALTLPTSQRPPSPRGRS